MNTEMKITAQKDARVNEEDRQALASLLLKFGYAVRVGKERKDGTGTRTTVTPFVAFKKQD